MIAKAYGHINHGLMGSDTVWYDWDDRSRGDTGNGYGWIESWPITVCAPDDASFSESRSGRRLMYLPGSPVGMELFRALADGVCTLVDPGHGRV